LLTFRDAVALLNLRGLGRGGTGVHVRFSAILSISAALSGATRTHQCDKPRRPLLLAQTTGQLKSRRAAEFN
jgi:hypothetical protein